MIENRGNGACVEWMDAPFEITAEEALAAEADAMGGTQDGSPDAGRPKQFLRETLANGSKPYNEICESATQSGISLRTLRRAKVSMNVVATKVGFSKKTHGTGACRMHPRNESFLRTWPSSFRRWPTCPSLATVATFEGQVAIFEDCMHYQRGLPARCTMARNSEAAVRIMAQLGPVPPGADDLRRVRRIIDPRAVYRAILPDGQVISQTGAAMIETADAFLAVTDAQEAWDVGRSPAGRPAIAYPVTRRAWRKGITVAVEAYAITEKGSLLVDTVRYLPAEARNAAWKLRKWQGDWKSMERAGFALVRVYVQASGPGQKPQPREHRSTIHDRLRSRVGGQVRGSQG